MSKFPDDAGWGILKEDRPWHARQVVGIRLHKKVSIDVLRLITRDVLLRTPPLYDHPTYINFYTPWNLGESRRGPKQDFDLDRTRFWADARLDFRPKPQLQLSIEGVTVENESLLRAVPLPGAPKVIGSWIDDERGGRLTIYRLEGDRLYLEEFFFDGRKRGEDHELIELPASNGRRFEDKSPDSDKDIGYFLIEETGDLQTHFKDGMAWKARALELD